MQTQPPTPPASDAPDRLFEEGHLWILEAVDGVDLRFQLHEAGYLRFGDGERVYADHDEVPAYCRPAVRHVRERLDRDALRAAVDAVEEVVFFGTAAVHRATDYDLERMPPLLGFDVWDGDTYLDPDGAERAFDRLGLEPANAVEREARARDFDPASYAMPDSAWHDGPAAGVVVRNKRGDRAVVHHPRTRGRDPASVEADAAELAARYATERRFEAAATALADRDCPVTVDSLCERVMETVAREEYRVLYGSDDPVDRSAFRSAVATLAGEFLADWSA